MRYEPRKNKKGQITIFLIIGVLLVAIAGTIYYLSTRTAEEELEPELEIAAEEVPTEVKPIQTFVQDCIFETAKDAIYKMGRHGGYIDPDDTLLSGRTFKKDPEKPVESEGVFLSQESNFIPFYWHLKSKSDCYNCISTGELAPQSEDIERQISQYVEQNINKCIDDFRSFEGQGFNVQSQGNIKATTVLTQKDVAVAVEYPLSVGRDDRTTQITRFRSRLPVQLRKIHQTARRIALSENQISFLENFLNSLISIYSGFNTERLPPYYATEDSFAKKYWLKSQVKNQIEDILSTYVPVLRVNQTANSETIIAEGTYEKSAYRSMNINALTEPAENLEVNFLYFGWPIYLEITPNEGEILTAYEKIKQNLLLAPPIITYKYQFFYDVSFPVLVQIRSKDAFFDEGYTYQFALEGNIRDNTDLRSFLEGRGTTGPYRPLYEFAPPEGAEEHEDYQHLPGVSEPMKPKLFCSEKQRNGGIINLTMTSEAENDIIEEAVVYYGCGAYASCVIGQATVDKETNITCGAFEVPTCINGGYIKVEADGHKTAYATKLTTDGGNQSLKIEMKKYKKVNVTIKKLPFNRRQIHRDNPQNWKGNYVTVLEPENSKTEMDKTDGAIIRLTRLQEEDELFPGDTQVVVQNNKENISRLEIELTPGEYEISGNLFNFDTLIIEPEKRCYSRDQVTDECEAEAYVPSQPGVEMDLSVSGGIEILEDAGLTWEVSEQELNAKNQLEITLVQIQRPQYMEDMNDLNEIDNLTVEYSDRLKPKLK